MGKTSKRKRQQPLPVQKAKASTTQKPQSHISVLIDAEPDATDTNAQPYCELHGPALRFRETFDDDRTPRTFFGCSANRERNVCRVRAEFAVDPADQATAYGQRLARNAAIMRQVSSTKPADRSYCMSCWQFIGPWNPRVAHGGHPIRSDISDGELRCPTRLLTALDNDTREAQYFFAEQTLQTIERWLVAAGIRRVVCIGAPRLHEHLREQSGRLAIRSVLCDWDQRLEPFYALRPAEFYRYNMFNGWMADGAERQREFDAFLAADDDSPLLFTDPPFGCRTEPLAATLRSLQQRFGRLRQRPLPAAPLPVMWIFPYFMGAYVQREMPQLRANEFAVEYTNHTAYRAGGRALGSPVRIFHNLPDALLADDARRTAGAYVACELCAGRWRSAASAAHCLRCGECPSLNGAAYRHCERCAQCVKPTYVHCEQCGRCVQRDGHECRKYRLVVTCWICRKRGHLERACDARMAARKSMGKRPPKGRLCLVCGTVGHNELRCPERAQRLGEWTFAGEVFNRFNTDAE